MLCCFQPQIKKDSYLHLNNVFNLKFMEKISNPKFNAFSLGNLNNLGSVLSFPVQL